MSLYGSDRELLETAVDWLRAGHAPLLVTVARTWGSSPRPPGSLMLLREDGRYAGSVSGGCVEEDLAARVRDGQLGDALPTCIDYGVDRIEASRLGLPCGGRLELLVERLEQAAPLERILAVMEQGGTILRRVCLTTGEASLHRADDAADFRYSDHDLRKVFGPRWRLLLIGAGPLARYAAAIAQMLDYQVLVCDPRDGPEEMPEGVERLTGMPDEAVRTHITHGRCAVVALTHDPKLDDLALLEALVSPAFFVGAIGSRHNSERRR